MTEQAKNELQDVTTRNAKAIGAQIVTEITGVLKNNGGKPGDSLFREAALVGAEAAVLVLQGHASSLAGLREAVRAFKNGTTGDTERRQGSSGGSRSSGANATRASDTLGERECGCGCGRPTKARFATGHDARLWSWINKDVLKGGKTPVDVMVEHGAAAAAIVSIARSHGHDFSSFFQDVVVTTPERSVPQAGKIETPANPTLKTRKVTIAKAERPPLSALPEPTEEELEALRAMAVEGEEDFEDGEDSEGEEEVTDADIEGKDSGVPVAVETGTADEAASEGDLRDLAPSDTELAEIEKEGAAL